MNILPQLLYLALSLMGLGITMAKHGQPQTGKHSFWISLTAAALMWSLLY